MLSMSFEHMGQIGSLIILLVVISSFVGNRLRVTSQKNIFHFSGQFFFQQQESVLFLGGCVLSKFIWWILVADLTVNSPEGSGPQQILSGCSVEVIGIPSIVLMISSETRPLRRCVFHERLWKSIRSSTFHSGSIRLSLPGRTCSIRGVWGGPIINYQTRS